MVMNATILAVLALPKLREFVRMPAIKPENKPEYIGLRRSKASHPTCTRLMKVHFRLDGRFGSGFLQIPRWVTRIL